jgi:predicted enzyme related to lactoylglutathione lyase
MARVLGIGGLMFKAADKEALKAWYVRVLKFELIDWGGVYFPPLTKGGTVWNPFAAETDHFKPSDAPYMLNLVVDDMAGILDHVRAEGVEVLGEEAYDGMGKFAWIMDPNGTKIELWQPDE